MNIYYNSVGMNCSLLLNVPPNKEGLFAQKDIDQLLKFRKEIEKIYDSPVVPSSVSAVDKDGNANSSEEVKNILTDDSSSYVFSDSEYMLDFTLSTAKRIKHIVFSEDSNVYSERVKKYSIYAKIGSSYIRVGKGESAGNKTVVKLGVLTPWTNSYRIVIEESKAAPAIRFVGLYS
jgi:alpha-L-fucosidase